jgi:hypothetical protein
MVLMASGGIGRSARELTNYLVRDTRTKAGNNFRAPLNIYFLALLSKYTWWLSL